MGYRFIRVTDYYPEYIKSYYSKNSTAQKKLFDDQYNELLDDSLEVASSYIKELNKINYVDAALIISNAHPLQEKWAQENNLSEGLTEIEIINAQLKQFKPDIIWIDTTSLLNKDYVNQLKKDIPSLKLLVGHICAPFNAVVEESIPIFDFMFTCSPCTVEKFKELGGNPYLLYHSFDSNVLDRLKNEVNDFPENDFVFTGSLITGFGMHKTRIEYLESYLKNKVNIKIFGNIESQGRIRLKQIMHYTIKSLVKLGLEKMVNRNSFLRKYKQYADISVINYSKELINSIEKPVFGLEMNKLLQKSKLCFNIHGDIAKRCAGNIRLFEATGLGSCLITDWKENMSELFDLENEIVTYKSMDECIEKVKWLMENPDRAKKIALAGQERTLKDHTVQQRIAELHDLFMEKMKTV